MTKTTRRICWLCGHKRILRFVDPYCSAGSHKIIWVCNRRLYKYVSLIEHKSCSEKVLSIGLVHALSSPGGTK